MHYLKSAKIYLLFATLLFVAKPFLGFSMFSSLRPPAEESIFIKAFTKRKQEYIENGSFDVTAIQKKLAEALAPILLGFAFFLGMFLYPVSESFRNAANRFLRRLRAALFPPLDAWLLNSQLII